MCNKDDLNSGRKESRQLIDDGRMLDLINLETSTYSIETASHRFSDVTFDRRFTPARMHILAYLQQLRTEKVQAYPNSLKLYKFQLAGIDRSIFCFSP